jgi:hypothetical protein
MAPGRLHCDAQNSLRRAQELLGAGVETLGTLAPRAPSPALARSGHNPHHQSETPTDLSTMSYALDPMQFQRISRLPAESRFDEFINQVAQHQQVWGLRSGNGWAVVDAEGDDCFPVWPHPDFAAAWAVGDLSDCKPQAIDLDAWLSRWTPGMDKDGTLVLVFPTNDDDDEGVVMAASELEDALLGAIGQA